MLLYSTNPCVHMYKRIEEEEEEEEEEEGEQAAATAAALAIMLVSGYMKIEWHLSASFTPNGASSTQLSVNGLRHVNASLGILVMTYFVRNWSPEHTRPMSGGSCYEQGSV